MNIWYVIKVNILYLLKGSYKSSPWCLLLNLEQITNFEHIVQLPLMPFWCPFLDPHLTAHHSNRGAWFILSYLSPCDLNDYETQSSQCQKWTQDDIWRSHFLRNDNEEYSLMGLVEMVCHICTTTTYSYKVSYTVLITCSALLQQLLLQWSWKWGTFCVVVSSLQV